MYRIVTNPEDGNRITRVTFEQYEQDNPNSLIVADKPEGDVTHYRYVDGAYLYDPPEETDPPANMEPPQAVTPEAFAELTQTVQTHDSEIDTILTGLEAINNGQ